MALSRSRSVVVGGGFTGTHTSSETFDLQGVSNVNTVWNRKGDLEQKLLDVYGLK